MIQETKVLNRMDLKRKIEEIEQEFPNANELQLEERAEREMKQDYVDTFIRLFQNNISFCWNLFNSDLGQRVLEQKERLIHQEEVDSDNDEELLLDSVELSREYIEDLF